VHSPILAQYGSFDLIDFCLAHTCSTHRRSPSGVSRRPSSNRVLTKSFYRVQEQLPAQPGPKGPQERVRLLRNAEKTNGILTEDVYRIKKPKTSRYPSLKGTDPKFRRNHRHALHGTAKALVRTASSAGVDCFRIPTDCLVYRRSSGRARGRRLDLIFRLRGSGAP
jgi:hypothetical protein